MTKTPLYDPDRRHKSALVRKAGFSARFALWLEAIIKSVWPLASWLAAGFGLMLLSAPALFGDTGWNVFGAVFWLGGLYLAYKMLRGFEKPHDTAVFSRVQKDSALPYRPLEILSDDPAGTLSAQKRNFWQQAVKQSENDVKSVRFSWPKLGASVWDKTGVRVMAAIMLIAGLIVAGSQSDDRILQGLFPFGGLGSNKNLGITIWIAPPEYTKTGDIVIDQFSQSGKGESDVFPVIPEGSRIQVSVSGLWGPAWVKVGDHKVRLEEQDTGSRMASFIVPEFPEDTDGTAQTIVQLNGQTGGQSKQTGQPDNGENAALIGEKPYEITDKHEIVLRNILKPFVRVPFTYRPDTTPVIVWADGYVPPAENEAGAGPFNTPPSPTKQPKDGYQGGEKPTQPEQQAPRTEDNPPPSQPESEPESKQDEDKPEKIEELRHNEDEGALDPISFSPAQYGQGPYSTPAPAPRGPMAPTPPMSPPSSPQTPPDGGNSGVPDLQGRSGRRGARAQPQQDERPYGMTFPVKIQDDYGVRRLELSLSLAPEIDEGPRIGGDIVLEKTITTPPMQQIENESFFDLSDHPWAGLPVMVTITAIDEAGQKAATPQRKYVLKERQFSHLLAKRLVDLRRKLIWSGTDAARDVAFDLFFQLQYPEDMRHSAAIWLGVKMASERLKTAKSDQDVHDIVDLLWTLALELEDLGISNAANALHDATNAISRALRRGNVDDEKMLKLFNEYRDAMSTYLDKLRQLGQERDTLALELPPEIMRDLLDPEPLREMFNQMEDLAQAGDYNSLEDMIARMQSLLESFALGGGMPPDLQAMAKGLNVMQGLIDHQKMLLTETEELSKKVPQSAKTPKKGFGNLLAPDSDVTRSWDSGDMPPPPLFQRQMFRPETEHQPAPAMPAPPRVKMPLLPYDDYGTGYSTIQHRPFDDEPPSPFDRPQNSQGNAEGGLQYVPSPHDEDGYEPYEGEMDEDQAEGMDMDEESFPEGALQDIPRGMDTEDGVVENEVWTDEHMPDGLSAQESPDMQADMGAGSAIEQPEIYDDSLPDSDSQMVVQEVMRFMLGEVMGEVFDHMNDLNENLPKAELEMRNSSRTLDNGRPDEAVPVQEEIIRLLEQAREEMQQQMRQAMGERSGMRFAPQGRDPLGRPQTSDEDGEYAEDSDVEVPDSFERKRVDDILDYLRKHAGDPDRPKAERDYFQRLLRRF